MANSREQLQERYEEALFRLWMNDLAAAEGEKALAENERLKNDPEAAVPEEIDRRCMQTIRQHFAKQKVYTVGRITVKALKCAALAAGIAAFLFVGAFAASETVRINTLNFMIEVFDRNMNFYFGEKVAHSDTNLWIDVGWIPEGYILAEQESDATSVWYYYQKSDSEYVSIEYIIADGTHLSVDTDNAEVDSIEINGVQATWIKTGSVQQIILLTANQEGFVDLIAEGMTETDFLHIARELKYDR